MAALFPPTNADAIQASACEAFSHNYVPYEPTVLPSPVLVDGVVLVGRLDAVPYYDWMMRNLRAHLEPLWYDAEGFVYYRYPHHPPFKEGGRLTDRQMFFGTEAGKEEIQERIRAAIGPFPLR